LPQTDEQSGSVFASQLSGQQPSFLPEETHSFLVWLHATSQLALLPVIWSMVQTSPSSQEAGQVEGGSHVSLGGSTTPLPQTGEQSESPLASHASGQQPSFETQVVMAVWLQATLQLALLPVF
jgi:hypothetical protein